MTALGWCLLMAWGGLPARWENVSNQDGIAVWQRAQADSALLEFRGRGVVEAPIDLLTAVLTDHERTGQWLKDCAESFEVERLGAGHAIVYNRTESHAPFVADRDAVVESQAVMLPSKRAVRVEFWSVEDARKAPAPGVVRVSRLSGFWLLQQQDAFRTDVTYQVSADPGGSLPQWLVNWAARGMPADTLKRLREHVRTVDNRPLLTAVHRAFDWSGFDIPEVAVQ
ncbi:MAG TPA: START domain-containing protein [Myxococcota bacterium]|nr:START domain-containing protein [Myxococcota bacterium]